ncbi:MAG TPA: lipocalin-like domain-containing protein [Vicinamibacterales bacterium]|nr:lipocalin-like domain-containing protein [Vicinamibacterales bacterium]
MKAMLLGAVVSCAMLSPVAGQSKPAALQGAWRVTEITLTGPNARTIKNPQPGMIVFTARHYANLTSARDEPRLALPPSKIDTATADELRAAWNLFTANAGTYEVVGDTLTWKVIVAKNQYAMNNHASQTYSMKLQGDTVTFVQKANESGPIANPTTFKLTRME